MVKKATPLKAIFARAAALGALSDVASSITPFRNENEQVSPDALYKVIKRLDRTLKTMCTQWPQKDRIRAVPSTHIRWPIGYIISGVETCFENGDVYCAGIVLASNGQAGIYNWRINPHTQKTVEDGRLPEAFEFKGNAATDPDGFLVWSLRALMHETVLGAQAGNAKQAIQMCAVKPVIK